VGRRTDILSTVTHQVRRVLVQQTGSQPVRSSQTLEAGRRPTMRRSRSFDNTDKFEICRYELAVVASSPGFFIIGAISPPSPRVPAGPHVAMYLRAELLTLKTFSRFFAEKVVKVRSSTADAPTFTHAPPGVFLSTISASDN